MKKQKKFLLTADNSLIYYEVSGKGMPLFLLHGNGGSGNYFKKQVPEFSRYFTVYTIDSRGHGRSTNQSETLTFEQMAEDLHSIMEHEHIVRANVVGFSDGANLAIVFVKKYPSYVQRLVLNAGNTLVQGVIFPIRVITVLEFMVLKLVALFSKKAREQLLVTSLMLHDIGISTLDLKQITQKTLVIVGKYDIIKQSHSIYLAKEIPCASFVLVPKKGHSFAKKDPETFNQEILRFLKEK
ncbi:alpha/beta fold hydrolase [Enterococcus caccae]|uniref:AB hydrolase-1 domain-containing protein n=1 Tax=Enterococcus caccae ATCC BAA-1240 TaxID=1158612 RepID=R3TTC8_9ENTE|nr:alpha/beta hydrolase [Enterococcus caccae]EOL44423.1 hypothetical protein UC7_02467 [Enterococcus caccae ATCC BAA-1240]EOT68461.1 hypothetical protein I580_00844 [Enterococcus caccae ATCC BAA-1240]OJG28328.1 hypothetical protein RU98_GL001576 [Enterococcus caccae]